MSQSRGGGDPTEPRPDHDEYPDCAHIPNEEIERDIADTEYEIAQMEREEQGFRLIGDRMSSFRADARRDGIKKRIEFVATLRKLLSARAGNDPSDI